MDRRVAVPFPPQRIVSLVPSQTELLFDLGLEDRIVGVTKFCIHPSDKVKQKTIIGGTKNFKLEVIDELQPDLIIGNNVLAHVPDLNDFVNGLKVLLKPKRKF